ncbi:3-keto-disaccharide hydrolase [Spirosoma fluminis]
MRTLFSPFVSLLLLLSLSSSILAQTDANRKEWVTLFNGKDLSGWDIKIAGQPLNDNYKNTFRVEKGVLRIAYDQYQSFDGKFGHLYYNKPFSYYIVRFTYRFVGNQTPGGAAWNVRNSGVMIHSQSAASLSMGQDFPVSLEVQLLGGLGKGPRHTANLCTPGTQVYINSKLDQAHCIDSDSKTFDGDQWVTAEAIVYGDSVIHHVVEGDTVLTYQRPEVGGGFVSKDYDWKSAHIDNGAYWISRANTPLKEGYIALQAESHPIDFRSVEVLNLQGCTDPKALNYKSYYVKSDNTQCRYGKK